MPVEDQDQDTSPTRIVSIARDLARSPDRSWDSVGEGGPQTPRWDSEPPRADRESKAPTVRRARRLNSRYKPGT